MLFRSLAPVETVWGEARDLVVAAGGALRQIPLSLLPVAATPPVVDNNILFAEMRNVRWLARKAAVSNSVSVNAFVRLRQLPPSTQQREPFVGFGDPQFAKAPGPGAAQVTRLRGLNIARVTESVDVTRQAIGYSKYADLTPLPDTREEILSIEIGRAHV